MLSNDEIAAMLDEVAGLLEAQGADPYRVRAWRRGADAVRGQPGPVAQLAARGGREALQQIPDVGRSLSRAIDEIAKRGRLAQLDRLRGEVSPEDLFSTLPGIGHVLAHRICVELGVETLEQLESAAHDGRLARVPGFGPARAEIVRGVLAARLGPHRPRAATRDAPPILLLLDVDREYRERADRGELAMIAPRRFNPEGKAWLPVLHVDRDGWSFTALFSNTARAHDLGRTRDWVVLYYGRDGEEGQSTVVTETHGALGGRRVVRGREAECLAAAQRPDEAVAPPP